MQVEVIYPADHPHRTEVRRIPYRYEHQENPPSHPAILEEVYRQFNHVDGEEFIAHVKPPIRSLSMGDMVRIDDQHYVCASVGWTKLSKRQAEIWEKTVDFAARQSLVRSIPSLADEEPSLVGKRVQISCNTDDGSDDKWIGWKGVVRSIEDTLAEVEIDGQGTDTFSFFTYQLEEIEAAPANG